MLSYLLATLTFAGIYALLALGLNVIWGMAGMINLGLAGFFALGAYASALATVALGLPIGLGVVIAIASAALAGALLSRLTLNLRGDYLAIVTLGFGEVIRLFAANEIWLTNGSDGISGIPGPFRGALTPLQFNALSCALVLFAVALAWLMTERLRRSPYGRALRAIRDDETAAGRRGQACSSLQGAGLRDRRRTLGVGRCRLCPLHQLCRTGHFPSASDHLHLSGTHRRRHGQHQRGCAGARFLVMVILEGSRFIEPLFHSMSGAQSAALREIIIGTALIVVMRIRPEGLLAERPAKTCEPLMTPQMTDAERLSELQKAPDLYPALERHLGEIIGHKLFTLMVIDRVTNEAARLYSSDPVAYPVKGRKPLGQLTDWGTRVLEQGEPYIGYNAEDIRSAFFDHETIARLGCASVLNLPVFAGGPRHRHGQPASRRGLVPPRTCPPRRAIRCTPRPELPRLD